MVGYESLLLGGDGVRRCTGGKMTYEDRIKNLEKARAVRQANLKKKQKGKGQWNQDYVDESQINYGGSPLDMYYMGSEKDIQEERHKRGEIGEGLKKKGRKPKKEQEEVIEIQLGGKVKRGGDMSFMKNSNHSGMDMPTEQQFQRGGRLSKKKHKKIDIDDL